VTVFVETERITLRRFTTDDVDLLVDLDSDPDVMFFITGDGRRLATRSSPTSFPRSCATTSDSMATGSGR